MSGFPKAGDEYGGRYRIVRQLGHGGMGVVYEAVDKVLNRSVALKIVLPSLPDREDFSARFAREASVLARIRSRNIVQIHEYGEDDDTVFFVTELFPDGDLQSWLATHGPLDRRASMSLLAQVCEALADAHAMGVIHRDVKPGNVLLWSRPEGLIPYLCDFGIAIDTPEEGATRASLTRTGTLIGSPAYMAPERHFGHAADERGDVYSLGCLLWSVLTGDAPYSGTDFQMMNAHINAPVPALDTGHPADDRLDAVLAGALNKDPERRTPSPAAMRAELLGIIKDIDSAVVPPPLPPAPAPATDDALADERDEGHTRATSLPAAAEGAGAAAVAATADVPAPPPASPPSGPPQRADSTVIRDLPMAPPPAPPRTSAPAAPAPGARRRWLPVALVAAGVAVALGATAAVVAATGGDDDPVASPSPSESSSPTTSATTSPSDEPVALAAPRPPRLAPTPGYRSVAFTVSAPSSAKAEGVTQSVQVDTGDGWQDAGRRVRVPTDEGGAQACVKARTVASNGSGDARASKPVRRCADAAPRTATFVRTPGPCTGTVNGYSYPCQWYGVRVLGFASGTAPTARLRGQGSSEYCADFDCQPVRVGADGRGLISHYFRIYADSGTYVLDVDGVTSSGNLTY